MKAFPFFVKSSETFSLTKRPSIIQHFAIWRRICFAAGEPGYPRLPGGVDHQRRPAGPGKRHPFPVGGERRPHHPESHLRRHGSVHLHGDRGRGLRLRPHLPLPPSPWAKSSSTLGVPWAKSSSRFECPERNLLRHYSTLRENFFDIWMHGTKSSTLECLERKLLRDLFRARSEIFFDIWMRLGDSDFALFWIFWKAAYVFPHGDFWLDFQLCFPRE